jgi:predicted RNA binding protein YcfA (HicA-like mRNA interferase family)
MSPKLPRVASAQITRVLEREGFALSRQSGSHMIYKNGIGLRVTIPHHSGKILHPKILQSILRDANLTVEDLLRLLD